MQLSLAEVQAATGALVAGTKPDLCFRGWSIDSRTTEPGDLFFAIKGDRLDGHAFVANAFDRGATAAVISDPLSIQIGPCLVVPDTLVALQSLAHVARRNWGGVIVGVTGSAGKTTTKDLIASVLSTRFRTAKTVGNFNNQFGLPLSLLRISEDAEIAVIEFGMNHAGEIRDLASLAEPNHAVVTNVGYAHIEAFETIDGIALAKRELVEALPQSGTAILNADDPRVLAFRDIHSGPVITYGFSDAADIRATRIEHRVEGAAFTLEGVRFETSLPGRHGISNILAALAVASLFDLNFEDLVSAIAAFKPGKMRGERCVWQGVTILNDSYNSNPEAVHGMVDVLRDEPAQRRIAVLGEMLELGRYAETLHRDVGRYVVGAGIDVLIGIRGGSRSMVTEAVDAAKREGNINHAAFFFDEPEAAGAFLHGFVQPGDAILFKGSRGTQVEKALATMKAGINRAE
ncbi:MAG TPA: UDP-N-acetylmuramoyl-tripeptide--D-alanyl-D-alanine ligase [Bryobacteraceae bacterium]|jgi:UDP-N-acetylmuramoyl-tripeptide--D-alanyl-D-alanine ligase|nr:UDP-N-acetylmuramoyl-tripeptide--D-alanyl-D-alanine ligase [Bryobacteraceae bacterium]